MAYIGKTPSQATRSRFYYTATGGETSLSGADDNGNTLVFSDGNYVDVMLNGVTLVAGTDYNTTTANTIGGLTALTEDDVVEIVVYDTFSVFGGDVKGNFNVQNGTLTAEAITGSGDMNIDSGTLFVDASADSVGIGTTSPGTLLELASSSPVIRFTDTDNSAYAHVSMGSFGGLSFNADVGNTRPSTDIKFLVDNSESMRIDSSGNLLVGKTAASIDTVGVEARANGRLSATMDGDVPLDLNRLTSDGNIALFRKDGSTVGSIGVNSGDILYIATADNAGLKFDGDNQRIMPANGDGTDSDADLDLGRDTNRFKDLYLSGGVYLGGTGSANYLDDYEEGTWTPTFTGVTFNSGSANGFYTKVGRMVTIVFSINNDNISSSETSATIGGLPFTNGAYRSSTSSFLHHGSFNEANVIGLISENNTNIIMLSNRSSGASWISAEIISDSGSYIQFTAVYYTDY